MFSGTQAPVKTIRFEAARLVGEVSVAYLTLDVVLMWPRHLEKRSEDDTIVSPLRIFKSFYFSNILVEDIKTMLLSLEIFQVDKIWQRSMS